jgi:uncharacterized protein (DUF2252 family)
MLNDRIFKFNQGRDPTLLTLKYKLMQADVFSFFRGTCHLFYEDWPTHTPLDEAPLIWVCGDLHLQNFGTYKGSDRLIYFDINDFDEAVLAPCTWDLARVTTSMLVVTRSLGINETDALNFGRYFLESYTQALYTGQGNAVQQDTATGLVKDLINNLKLNSRQAFLDVRTVLGKNKRSLRIDGDQTRSVSDGQRLKVTECIEQWATQQPDPSCFRVLDIAYRVAGVSSLGLERFVILVEGKGSPHRNYLLDLKSSRCSALQPYSSIPQPQWLNQATRIVTIQQRVLKNSPLLLDAVEIENQSYILRELQPWQDRLNLKQWDGKPRRLEKVIWMMANVIAGGHLRSGGQQGSAIASDLINFAKNPQWHKPMLEYAQTYSLQVEADYHSFCRQVSKAR